MSTIVVTGASGFIGRHLVPRLIDAGHSVRGVYRGLNEPAPVSSAQWVTVANPALSADWSATLGECDVVVHLAGLAHQSGPSGRGRLQEFMRVNSEMPRALARAMADEGRPMRLVFVSSVGAVASTSDSPLTEGSEPHPDTDYGRSKLAGERAVVTTLAGTAVDWCILRPPLVYGPGDPGNLARLVRLVRSRWPLPLGAVQSRRSLLYVGNLADAIALCATAPAASRRTYFVADDEQPTLRELLMAIGRSLRRSPRILYVPLPALRWSSTLFELASKAAGKSIGLDRYALERLLGSLTVDATPIRRELDWRPPYTLERGLSATLSNGT